MRFWTAKKSTKTTNHIMVRFSKLNKSYSPSSIWLHILPNHQSNSKYIRLILFILALDDSHSLCEIPIKQKVPQLLWSQSTAGTEFG